MGQEDQRQRIEIHISLRGWMFDPGVGRGPEQKTQGRKKPGISLGNLFGAIDTDLGDIRGNRFAVRVRKRNGIAVVVFRIDRMRMSPMMMSVGVIRNGMAIMVMVQIQHPQPRIVMASQRPDHEGQGGDPSHQEFALAKNHYAQSSASNGEMSRSAEKRILARGQPRSRPGEVAGDRGAAAPRGQASEGGEGEAFGPRNRWSTDRISRLILPPETKTFTTMGFRILNPLFPLGQVCVTAGVAALGLDADEIVRLVRRHHRGDWGDLGDEDKRANELVFVIAI